jgi:glutamine amidotransferase
MIDPTISLIGVIDYGTGNLGSVVNMLKHIGTESRLVSSPAEIDTVKALILPGVGHFGHAMNELHNRGFADALKRRVLQDRVPILGICLGMQLLANGSEEGDAQGLGFIDARFEKIVPLPGKELKVPHMGWNTLSVKRPNPILPSRSEERFYFVHSYKAICERDNEVIATTDYGGEFCCAYGRDNIYGVQFHPEKSHRFGMELLRRFVAFAC